MNKGFIPLAASLSRTASAPAGGGPKVQPDAPAANLFRSVNAAASQPAPQPPAGAEPKVTLERDGDRITRIKIQCCCGHVIELACNY